MNNLLNYCNYYVMLIFIILPDTPTCRDMLWFLGDNFTAKSYRAHFKKRDDQVAQHYIKANYDSIAFCNSRFASKNTNMISRLQNTFAHGLNHCKNGFLPLYVIVVLDDDMITYLNYQHDGAATLLGSWIEWLVKQFNGLLQERIQQLPSRCVKFDTFFYWVSAPLHNNFSKECNNLRVKFNLSLDSVIRTQTNMRVVRMKNWNAKDSNLVVQDHFTELGMSTYWDAIDATFQYNEVRRQSFLTKQIFAKEKQSDNQTAVVEPSPPVKREDPMIRFFNSRRRVQFTGSHERRRYYDNEFCMETREDTLRRNHRFQDRMQDARFLLPRLTTKRH